VTGISTDRSAAEELDAADPLAGFRERFVRADPSLIYLDGNSLGMLPEVTAQRIAEVVRLEWGAGLIGSWDHWLDLPQRTGDLLGRHLLGAAPGQVVVADSTTVNLYKLAWAALDERPGRHVIVTDDDNFPTDRYVLEGLARQRGAELRLIHTDLDEGVDASVVRAAVGTDTALVSLSHVAYGSGALVDMAALTAMVHDAGALMLWDLSHSVGSVPVDLDSCGADLAVGCSYKYLNAGPGAPAFLYVRRNLQPRLRQPVQGWFGHRDKFAMGPDYDPAPGIGRFLTGSPNIIGTVAVEEGARLLGEAGIGALRAKGMLLTDYLITLADAWLTPLGCLLASPRDAARRGSHVSLRHPEAERINQALIRAGVIGDYRNPDRLRLGPAPISTRFTDVWDALTITRKIIEAQAYEQFPGPPREDHLIAGPAEGHLAWQWAASAALGEGRKRGDSLAAEPSARPARSARSPFVRDEKITDPQVIPYLLSEDAGAAADWLVNTFGFTIRTRDVRADGTLRHAELQLDGGGVIMLGSPGHGFRGPGTLGGVTQLVRVTVTDLNRHRDHAMAANAGLSEMEPSEIKSGPPGWNSYSVTDPEGHQWYFTQPT